MTAMQQGLAPVVGQGTQLLVLGSFPGVASLQAQAYYGHPRNQFWRLMGQVLTLPTLHELSYAQRLQALQDRGVGLWDVLTEAQRQGSLDSNIRAHVTSDLPSLLATLPALRAVAFNGGTAARIGMKQLGPWSARLQIFQLPSSSPAFTLSFEQKCQVWLQLKAVWGPYHGALTLRDIEPRAAQ